jgi:hypothetical protein
LNQVESGFCSRVMVDAIRFFQVSANLYLLWMPLPSGSPIQTGLFRFFSGLELDLIAA